ncbi:MAG: NADH-quinone oxidoreductase subunit H [Syntrophorhabdaceae bacterium]|nr:NADH-quinone oxidoreductase subunit H [Syntrophorhabdaceae bacterium]
MTERLVDAIPGVVLALALSPLLLGIINKTKAFVGGRSGPPFLQPYHDIIKLLRKGAVYSRTTSWVFRAGPVVVLASALGALMVVPLAGRSALFSFSGDLILLVYFLGMMRFFIVLAALDTGSAFEGMGASREVQFSVLAEPALLLALAALLRQTEGMSLAEAYGETGTIVLHSIGPEAFLVAAALMVVFLSENSRIPVDDPDTHLELTMVHEVMVLDHGGPDFGIITYAASLKIWVLGALIVGIVLPVRSGSVVLDLGAATVGMFVLAFMVGLIESGMARLRMLRIPHLLSAALVLAGLALILGLE